MKYLIKFWDKHELVVSEKIGEQLQLAKLKKIECVKIDNALYELKAISYIEPIKETQTHNLLPERITNPVRKETIERVTRELVKKFSWKL